MKIKGPTYETATMEVVVLGFTLGTATAYDMVDESTIYFYSFKPAEAYKEHLKVESVQGGLQVDYQSGKITVFDLSVVTKEIEFKDIVNLV